LGDAVAPEDDGREASNLPNGLLKSTMQSSCHPTTPRSLPAARKQRSAPAKGCFQWQLSYLDANALNHFPALKCCRVEVHRHLALPRPRSRCFVAPHN
jgi:hypothetical protein